MAVRKKETFADKMRRGQSYNRAAKTIKRRKSAGGAGG